jgi:hypothetical protein
MHNFLIFLGIYKKHKKFHLLAFNNNLLFIQTQLLNKNN